MLFLDQRTSGNYKGRHYRDNYEVSEAHPFSPCKVTKEYSNGKRVTFILGRNAMTADCLGINPDVAKLMNCDNNISRGILMHSYGVTISS